MAEMMTFFLDWEETWWKKGKFWLPAMKRRVARNRVMQATVCSERVQSRNKIQLNEI